jgi:hypothetical protein
MTLHDCVMYTVCTGILLYMSYISECNLFLNTYLLIGNGVMGMISYDNRTIKHLLIKDHSIQYVCT